MSRQSLLFPLRQLLRSPSEKSFRCEWCRRSFNGRDELLEHTQETVQTTSSGRNQCDIIQPHRCEWCDARIGTADGLAAHARGTMQISTPEGPKCLYSWPQSSGDQMENNKELKTTVSGIVPSIKSHVEEATVSTTSLTTKGNTDEFIKHAFEANIEDGTEASTRLQVLNEKLTASNKDAIGTLRGEINDHGDIPEAYLDNCAPHGLGVSSATDPYTAMQQISRGPSSIVNSYDSPNTIGSFIGMNSLNYNVPRKLDTTGSTRSYVTARTSPSFASYRTAPSISRRPVPRSAMDTFMVNFPPGLIDLDLNLNASESELEFKTLDELARHVLFEAESVNGFISASTHITVEATIRSFCRRLDVSKLLTLTSFSSGIENIVQETCEIFFSSRQQTTEILEFRGAVARHLIDYLVTVCDLGYLASELERYFCMSNPLRERQPQVFSSKWLNHLRARGLMPDPHDELNWSGRGQHIEYDTRSGKYIPLTVEKTLGYSATAIVDSVMCRRIRLARKKIRCSRQLTKQDYIVEVEHLHRLQHAHVLRVVGTYTFKQDLAILLYPAAPWNLEEFLDEMLDTESPVNSDVLRAGTWKNRTAARSIRTFFSCLIHSLAFIHGKNVKHMDIKPKNLLVGAHNAASDTYKIYIADFGIARSYKSAHDAETDSPIPFTRTYAAPEVALQDVRGFSADIFSLGCVFLEMLATLISNPARNERHNLAEIRTAASGDSSYHANLLSVNDWFHQVFGDNMQIGRVPTDLLTEIPKMLQVPPAQRPSAAELDASFTEFCCNTCDNGPEPFEAAARS